MFVSSISSRPKVLLAGMALLVPAMPSTAQTVDDGDPLARDEQIVPGRQRRSDENAVAKAQDAFGVAVGREQLGLYESEDVRGFSPLAAGNARIEGLYFDPVAEPNARLKASTTIRVGIAAQGYSFIAPTGIVDYGLRKPEASASLSVLASADAWGSASIDADGAIPLAGDALSLGFGGSFGRQEFGDGTEETVSSQGLIMRWRPVPSADVTGFWSRTEVSDAVPSPLYLSDTDLPPLGPRRQFDGPSWALAHQVSGLTGMTATASLSANLQASVGAFRSYSKLLSGFSLLRTDFDASGGFRQLVIADLPRRTRSNSGEARLTRDFEDGERQHRVELSLRFRDRAQSYGGSAVADLGRHMIGAPIDVPPPALAFAAQRHDQVRQWSAGLSYEGRWRDVGQIGIGLIKTGYRKRTRQPEGPNIISKAQPWLFSTMGRVHLLRQISLYGSFAQGLEESEQAPDAAINRGQPVPATATRQVDGGLRWQIRPGLNAVAGVFELEKPYFSLDAADRYVQLGTIRNRGVELSLAGALTPRLDLVLGTLVQNPRVIGRAVEEGLIGARPVGLLSRISTLNLDWRPPVADGVSLDLSIASRSREIATTDNEVAIPKRTIITVGGRYRFRLGRNDAVLRLTVANITDEQGYVSRGPGAYAPLDGRLLSGYFTLDF